jgi:hypothetical protein
MHGEARRLALGGMLCALAEVLLLLGGMVPAALYACPILAMLALLPVREECGQRLALAAYGAVALLALLLSPDKELAGVYLALGWYPTAQPYLDRIRPAALRALCKLALFLLSVTALYAALLYLFQLDAVVREWHNTAAPALWALGIMSCGTFFLMDAALHRMTMLWRTQLRRRWFKPR